MSNYTIAKAHHSYINSNVMKLQKVYHLYLLLVKTKFLLFIIFTVFYV